MITGSPWPPEQVRARLRARFLAIVAETRPGKRPRCTTRARRGLHVKRTRASSPFFLSFVIKIPKNAIHIWYYLTLKL